MTMQEHEEEVRFQIGGAMLAGTLAMPERALGIVLFANRGFSADGMVEHDGPRGSTVEETRRPRHCRQHHRDLLDRQRAALQRVARCCRHPVPRREEHEMGGMLQFAVLHPLARQDSRRRPSTASSRLKTGYPLLLR
jgi:hypothetical protein